MPNSSKEPQWLAETRKKAKECFDLLPLEQSQYTKLDLDFDEILKNASRSNLPTPKRLEEFMKDKSRTSIVQFNNKIIHVNMPESLKGVIICSFEEALEKHGALVKKFFEQGEIKPSESKLIAFNYANFDSGIFIHIPEGVEIQKPIYHFVFLDSGSTISQTLVDAGSVSGATIIQELYSTDSSAFFSNIVEIHAQDAVRLNFAVFQNFSKNVTSFVNKRAKIGKDSGLRWIVARFGSGFDKSVRDTVLAGQGSEVDDVEIFFGDGTQHFDITSNIRHAVPNTRGNVLVKGVLKGSARSVSQGMIRIDKDAQKTDSFLAEHTLMLDPRARSDAIPGLEIEANDVRATHSASTSQIDKEQIFYLNARGISEKEAKRLIVLGFLESALQKIPNNDISDKFKSLVESKWNSSEL